MIPIHDGFFSIREVGMSLGLNINQVQSYRKRAQRDPLLSSVACTRKITTNGGIQSAILLPLNYLPIFLGSINRSTLNDFQYQNLITLYNWTTTSDFSSRKADSPIYTSEKLLEDDLYPIGQLEDVIFTGRQVPYPFGIIDIEGIDSNGTRTLIELKKDHEEDSLIDQCINYRDSFRSLGEEVRVLIIAYDCSRILDRATSLEFECYEYERKLSIRKAGHNYEYATDPAFTRQV